MLQSFIIRKFYVIRYLLDKSSIRGLTKQRFFFYFKQKSVYHLLNYIFFKT